MIDGIMGGYNTYDYNINIPNYMTMGADGPFGANNLPESCSMCDSRRYVDVSDDSSVSFQTPTHISPEASFSAVKAHEGEHVANDRAEAEREGRRVIFQSVIYHADRCPECGKVFMAGGTTRTVTAAAESDNSPYAPERGEYIDVLI